MWTLPKLEELFNQRGYECTILPESDEQLFEALLVPLGLDQSNRERSLVITLVPQLISASDSSGYQLIQFRAIYPFDVAGHAVIDTARTVSLINTGIELPGLEFNEIEGQVAFRHALLDGGSGLDPLPVLSVVGTIQTALDIYGGTLEAVATGRETFLELLEKVAGTVAVVK